MKEFDFYNLEIPHECLKNLNSDGICNVCGKDMIEEFQKLKENLEHEKRMHLFFMHRAIWK